MKKAAAGHYMPLINLGHFFRDIWLKDNLFIDYVVP